jgi:hypothetical protein
VGKLRKLVKLKEQAQYPTTEQAIGYADDFRQNYQDGGGDVYSRHQYLYNEEVDVYVRGCANYHYQVYAWAVAGFEIDCLDEVELKEDWIGWVLEYDPGTGEWHVLAHTRTEGIEGFKAVKHLYCPTIPVGLGGWTAYEPEKPDP